MLITGRLDLQSSLEVRVGYLNIPWTNELEELLHKSLTVNPYLEYLQVEPKRDPSVLCVINGKLDMPLDAKVRDALNLSGPTKMTARVLARILDIKAKELISLLAQVVGSDEPIEVKYPGLWLG